MNAWLRARCLRQGFGFLLGSSKARWDSPRTPSVLLHGLMSFLGGRGASRRSGGEN